MIDRVRIQGFRAHVDTQLELGRFTVLVGDNASGKTSVLDALRVLHLLVNDGSTLPDGFAPPDLFTRNGDGALGLAAEGHENEASWTVSVGLRMAGQSGWVSQASGSLGGRPFRIGDPAWPTLASVVGSVGAYSLQPEKVADAAHSDDIDARVAADGTNTAVVLASMILGKDLNFERIEAATRRLIPSVEKIKIVRAELRNPRTSKTGDKIMFDFRGAPNVPAHAASRGTLILVSLLTILYSPNRPRIVLLDDLDHALHPRAQMDTVRLLRELTALPEFADLQIIATTHSPYVLDMVDPEDVYAFAMRDDGTSASKRLSEHPDAAKMKGILGPGQLWSLDEERAWVLRNAS